MNGKDRASNRFELRLPLELQMLIQEDMAKNKQYIGTAVLRALTEHYKDRLTPQEYEALIKKYSMTAKEQREKNRKKQKDREARTKKRLQQRDLALELRKRELAIREANTGIRTEKHSKETQREKRKANMPKIRELNEEKRNLKLKIKHFPPESDVTKQSKARIKEINEELKALGMN